MDTKTDSRWHLNMRLLGELDGGYGRRIGFTFRIREALRTINRFIAYRSEGNGCLQSTLGAFDTPVDFSTRIAIVPLSPALLASFGIVCEPFAFEEQLFPGREHKCCATSGACQFPVHDCHRGTQGSGQKGGTVVG